jgi:hypothetical protein
MEEQVLEYTAWGIPSKCHIRVLNEPGKPVTVVCSQMIDNLGGSVTNYMEDIRRTVDHELRSGIPSASDSMKENLPRPDTDSAIDAIVAVLTADIGYPVRLALKTVPWAWKFYSEHKGILRRIDDLVWVEHYPQEAVASLFPHDVYAVVTFDSSTGAPAWEHLKVEEIASRTGYSVPQLQKDPVLLRGA